MESIGIITYHAAHNYGSVLQAFATEKIVSKFAEKVEIINYRMPTQKDFYSLYRTSNGIKSFVADILKFPMHNKRKKRSEAFERFICDHLILSKECTLPSDVYSMWDKYGVIISGSDQIWNIHSKELKMAPRDYIYPYLLRGYHGKRISYASSIANMTSEEIDDILTDLKNFQHISMRETTSAKLIEKKLSRCVQSVLDPTLLLSGDDWRCEYNLPDPKEEYILFYSLGNNKVLSSSIAVLKELSKRLCCPVKVIMPFAITYANQDTIEFHPEYGPLDFLNAINNAKLIVTDSYHGTVFSINFEKAFYSICLAGGSEYRKTDLLKRLGMEDRAISNIQELKHMNISSPNYCVVNKRIERLRKESISYIENSLNN